MPPLGTVCVLCGHHSIGLVTQAVAQEILVFKDGVYSLVPQGLEEGTGNSVSDVDHMIQ